MTVREIQDIHIEEHEKYVEIYSNKFGTKDRYWKTSSLI